MSEKYISPAEREYIAKAWRNYASVAEIATHLGKSRKTIYAELRRGQDGEKLDRNQRPIRTREENAMDNRSTAISAVEVADDRAEITAAVKAAKAFRDKLEAAGISYHKLLTLEEARRDMNDLAHHILLGWENGEGFPHE